ncbi:Six-hairpin glycosidase, partial [Acephala macrosclerotiorum]
TWDDDRWIITETAFNPSIFYSRIPQANGQVNPMYFGTTVAAAGPFFERDVNKTNQNGNTPIEGWPLDNVRQTFTTLSGLYDCQDRTPRTNFEELTERGCESVISGLPYPMGLYLTVGNTTLNSTVDPSTISNFEQTLSYRNGTVTWSYTWSPNNTNITYEIDIVSMVSRDNRNVAATYMYVTPRGGNETVKIADFIDGHGGVRSRLGTKYVDIDTRSTSVSVHPDGKPDVAAWLVSTIDVSNGYTDENSGRPIFGLDINDPMSIGQEYDVHLKEGETATFVKYVGAASTDGFPSSAEEVARNASQTAFETGWDQLFNKHTTAWNLLMHEHSVASFRDPMGHFPNDTVTQMLQIQEIASRYYLLSNLQVDDDTGLNANGVAVGGLTSDTYGGMVFWDQEFWIWPAIALTNPDYAMQIIKYRDRLFEAAKANAQEPYVQAKYAFDNGSSLFPWTSGRFGNATGTGPVLDYEYHLNPDIALVAINQYYISGNEAEFRTNHWDRVKSAVHTFMGLVVKEGDKYSTKNMTEPDEYANHKNNGAFTNAAFTQLTGMVIELQKQFGESVNETWAEVASNINIPRAESGITLEYEGMENTGPIKQADASLLIFPMNLAGMSLKQMKDDLVYYGQRVTPDGPAMNAAISSIATNRVAVSGCGASIHYSQATAPFLRAPWYQMSEQANDDMNANGGVAPSFPFLTGHGGAGQIPLYGFLGFSLNSKTLSIRPSLPLPFHNLRLPDFYFQGSRFRAAMNTTHTNITRLPGAGARGLVEIYLGQSMPIVVERRKVDRTELETINYTLAMNETLTVLNDMYWKDVTTEGNIIQCYPPVTRAANVVGQYPGALNDGDTSTKFQAGHQNRTKVVIDNSEVKPQRLQKFKIDWAGRPAMNYTLTFSNSSKPEPGQLIVNQTTFSSEVFPSKVYGTNESDTIVVPYIGNTTEWQFKPDQEVWSGNYTILEFEGCRECGDDQGATVAELEVISFS